ncbi:MAG: hypothetical protein KDD52_05010 [Bdellovibrionales bacterium]|nr:hypothetical protein [Bdellovibrionales bacterium]
MCSKRFVQYVVLGLLVYGKLLAQSTPELSLENLSLRFDPDQDIQSLPYFEGEPVADSPLGKDFFARREQVSPKTIDKVTSEWKQCTGVRGCYTLISCKILETDDESSRRVFAYLREFKGKAALLSKDQLVKELTAALIFDNLGNEAFPLQRAYLPLNIAGKVRWKGFSFWITSQGQMVKLYEGVRSSFHTPSKYQLKVFTSVLHLAKTWAKENIIGTSSGIRSEKDLEFVGYKLDGNASDGPAVFRFKHCPVYNPEFTGFIDVDAGNGRVYLK